jgi:hypothetical protein
MLGERRETRILLPRLPLLLFALSLVLAGCDGDDDDTTGAGEYLLEALRGAGGVALFVDPAPEGGAIIEGTALDGAIYSIPLGGADRVVDSRGVAGTRYVLLDGDEELAHADVVSLEVTAQSEPGPPVLLDGELLQLELTLLFGDLTLPRGDLLLRRHLLPNGETTYLNPDCLDDSALTAACWTEQPSALFEDLAIDEIGETLQLPDHDPAPVGPQVEELQLLLRVVDEAGAEVFAGGGVRAVFLGSSLKWGDPHAHSNLSHDGCEVPDADCGNRGAYPGEDFFANAVDVGLDFAASTEHGEWHELWVDDELAWLLWDETLSQVDDALIYEDQGFVPLLGYEWTNFRNPFDILDEGDEAADFPDDFDRGHKTVLFRNTDVCERYRIGAPTLTDAYRKGDSGLVYRVVEDRPVAATVEDLLIELEAAEEECGAEDLLTFFHHPAYMFPNPVSWSLEANAPDPDVEMLVEVASEHGSSECRDPTQEGCDFWVNDQSATEHLWWGSIQEALTQGHRLGFLGGSDSHDARPGSLDEASTIGAYWDADGDGEPDLPSQLFQTGAVTGVWIEGGFDRDSLWEGLTSRRTMATTGPRGRVALVALDQTGTPYLPGGVIPATRFPLQLTAIVEPGDDWELEAIEVVEPGDGTVIASTEDTCLEVGLADPGTHAFYVRARINDGETEHRVWLSPLFIER